MWYFNSLDPYTFGYSWKAVQWKATQYNFGSSLVPSSCKPQNQPTTYKPSAYAWTVAFLAWGNGYAVSDARYVTQYAKYAAWPTGTQKHYFNPSCQSGITKEILPPSFTPTYALQKAPYGRRSTGKQFVILARTDADYVSALAVGLHIKRTISGGVEPVVTSDTYFACDSMKMANSNKLVCVIALGNAAKTDVANVFPGAQAYSSFSAWKSGSADGYIDAPGYTKARDEGVAAHNDGY